MFPNPRPRFPVSGLLATGQTTSYGSGTGVDDGALRKGIAKSYTILTTGQYSGTVAITINSKTDTKSNNCVLDNNTGIMFSRYVSATLGPSSNGLLAWTTNVNGEGIFSYCAAANVAGLAGYSDWRIPNMNELMSIRGTAAASAVPDTTAFPSFPASVAWSSTTAPNATTFAIQGNFLSGSLPAVVKTTTSYALLVRG